MEDRLEGGVQIDGDDGGVEGALEPAPDAAP